MAGSSLELIEKLHPYNVEYYFTDVSKFFFNEAKNFSRNTIGLIIRFMILINAIGIKDLRARNLILYYVETFCIMQKI